MLPSTALVITSIAAPNTALKIFASGCQAHNLDFIVVGDVKSPTDFRLEGCDFWDMDRQKSLPYQLSKILPEGHYARKNLGYLIAMDRGAETIIETDDDNSPLDVFWEKRQVEQSVQVVAHQGWVNIYRFFADRPIWPRGYPLECVQSPDTDIETRAAIAHCPIQQGLADGNPDVDAVYRLVMPLPVSFKEAPPIALEKGCWAPFNSQNTTWFREAFPLLYIPYHCSFRMCDIWRSFIVQRICWENDWHVMFHGATVYQERNEHDLIQDFRDEVPGYLNNSQICKALSDLGLKGGIKHLGDDLKSCYEVLIKFGHVGKGEIPLINAWIEDVASRL